MTGYVEVYPGCFVLPSTAAKMRKRDEEERKRREWYEEATEYLRTHDRSDPDYWYIYKDVYGVRPRW